MTMETQSPASILYNLVKSQNENDGLSSLELERHVRAAGTQAAIPEPVIEEVVTRFRREAEQVPPSVLPRLFVDWGELPRMGYQVRPEFTLVCPGYTGRPTVRISVDRELDHDPQDRLRRPISDEDGLWSFHVPFRMTSDGMDCLPGQYLIDLQVSFPSAPAAQPRFFRSRIRLKVSGMGSDSGGVLEIDGDGQSVVNLQGYNLKQFSKVVLKGGQDGVINLQNAISTQQTNDDLVAESDKTTFEYELKVNTEIQSRLPTVSGNATTRARLDSALLKFEDGRHFVIVARRKMTFGRGRDNDVILRFLPANEQNDHLCRIVSRTHMSVELIPDGIEVRDEQSRWGIEVDYSVVEQTTTVSPHHIGESVQIDLGTTGAVSEPFHLEMTLLSSQRDREKAEVAFWDELYAETVGARVPRLTREAWQPQVDALRFDRVNNLSGEEAYVMLFREALIGGSSSRSGVILKYEASHAIARFLHIDRSFWLERLPGTTPVTVNDQQLPLHQLTPLSPGMSIAFGSEKATFQRPSQIHIR